MQAADGRIKSGHDVFCGVMRGLDPRISQHLTGSLSRHPGVRRNDDGGESVQAADGRIKSGHDVCFGVMRGLDPAHLDFTPPLRGR